MVLRPSCFSWENSAGLLYRSRFLVGSHNEELDVSDVTWLSPSGEELTTEQRQDGNTKCFGMLLDGRAQETGIKRRGSDATMLLVYNAQNDVVTFTLPAVADGLSWLGLIDTNQPDARMVEFEFGHAYAVTGRSLLVLGLANDNIATHRLRQGLGALLDVADTPLSG